MPLAVLRCPLLQLLPSSPGRRLWWCVPAMVLGVVVLAGALAPQRCAAAAGAAPPAAGERVGLNVHAPEGDEVERLLDEVAASGARWIRVDFVWAEIEPEAGSYRWERWDRIVEVAGDRGLEVLGLLQSTPAWATDGAASTGVPRVGDWQRFCFAAAQRYRGRVSHWEIWNEPNLRRFFTGSRRDYIERLLLPGADAIHAADPAARVGGPATAHRSDGDSDWYLWLYEALTRGRGRIDFATHHVYAGGGHRHLSRRLEGATVAGDLPAGWGLWQPSVREVLAAAGWLGRPFWLTETGWPTVEGIARVPSEAWQAEDVGGLLAGWVTPRPERAWLGKVFVYELADGGARGVSRFGLLRADGSRKPAWWALRDFLTAAAARPPAGRSPHPAAGGGAPPLRQIPHGG